VLLWGSPPWLRWLVWAARGLGWFGLALFAVCAVGYMTAAPYPLFQSSLWRLQKEVVVIYAALWVAVRVFAYRCYRATKDSDTLVAGALGDFVLMATAGLGAWCALPCVNALCDRSPLSSIPVKVTHVKWRRLSATPGSTTHPFATVHRLDNQGDDVVLDWGSCKPAPPESSPLATLRVGHGALGAAWISLPVLCRLPAVGDRPLVPGLSLGQGSPVVLVVLRTDAMRGYLKNRTDALEEAVSPLSDPSLPSEAYVWRLQGVLGNKDVAESDILTAPERLQLKGMLEPLGEAKARERQAIVRRAIQFAKSASDQRESSHALPKWMETIERARPGVSVLIIYDGSPPTWAKTVCAGNCRMAPRRAVDSEILALFAKVEYPWHDDLLYIADGAGRNVFSSPLADLEGRSECAKRLERMSSSTK
jgi:hypothetical protein